MEEACWETFLRKLIIEGLGFVVGGLLFVPGCPDHEIITQKLYYLQYCLTNSLRVFLANSYL